jgi:hypothetical protein
MPYFSQLREKWWLTAFRDAASLCVELYFSCGRGLRRGRDASRNASRKCLQPRLPIALRVALHHADSVSDYEAAGGLLGDRSRERGASQVERAADRQRLFALHAVVRSWGLSSPAELPWS